MAPQAVSESEQQVQISVVYPAYNEEESLETTVQRSIQALEKFFANFEIIIVNDASTDSTPAIAQRLSASDSRIRVINNEKNLRQGESLLKAFAVARGDLITHNGVDYPFDLNDLALILPRLEDNDVVVASRKGRPGYTPYRLFLSHANLFLLHFLFDMKLRDYSFIQVYKRAVVRALLGDMKGKSTGFAMPELLLRANDAGFRIDEVSIEYLPREAGVARAGAIKVVIASLIDVFSYWRERTFKRMMATSEKQRP